MSSAAGQESGPPPTSGVREVGLTVRREALEPSGGAEDPLRHLIIYDRHFAAYRGRPITLLEIGIFHGGSLQMWKEYFGSEARIVGVDIDPRCSVFEDEQVKVLIGDQEDRDFLTAVRDEIGTADIIIDDGGHTMSQQLTSFGELWPAVSDGGVYLVEDLHTSYWPEYGGGYRGPVTFIEFSKLLVDSINAWHTRGQHPIDVFTRSLAGMHIYDSIIVFDKASVAEPTDRMTGVPSFDLPESARHLLQPGPDAPA